MAVKIQLRRGTEAEYDSAHGDSAITPADGEVLVVQESGTSGGYLVIGDGSKDWLQLKNDVDGRVYFKPAYSQTIMGGEQPVDATPLTVKGATSQTAAILKVTNQDDNSIFEIYDDEGPVVRLEDHGDAGEVFMRIRGQASSTANILEVQTGESGNATQIAVDPDGLVTLTPTDNQSADDPTLLVQGSAGDQTANGVLQVKKANNTNLLSVATNKAEVNGPPLIVQADGDATSNVTLVGTTDAAAKAITVDDGGTENFAVTAGGKITSNGHHGPGVATLVDSDVITFKDFKSLRVGHRTLSVLDTPVDGRQSVDLKIQEFVGNSGSFSSTSLDHLLTHTIEQTTSVNATNPDPDLHTAPSGSVYQIFKLPNGEACDVTFDVLAHGKRAGNGLSDEDIILTTQILTYTSKDLLTGKSVVSEKSLQSSGGSGGIGLDIGTHPSANLSNSTTISNSTGSDLFVAVAMKIVNDGDAGSNNRFRANGSEDGSSGATSNMDITIVGKSGF